MWLASTATPLALVAMKLWLTFEPSRSARPIEAPPPFPQYTKPWATGAASNGERRAAEDTATRRFRRISVDRWPLELDRLDNPLERYLRTLAGVADGIRRGAAEQ